MSYLLLEIDSLIALSLRLELGEVSGSRHLGDLGLHRLCLLFRLDAHDPVVDLEDLF